MLDRNKIFDVVVIGAGHAGCEAYAAACRIGVRAALVTPSLNEAGFQPCNPAVGGSGKGHLVREVVALGGLMGEVTDRSGLQFRTLNMRKGPAVRSTRVQTDSEVYVQNMTSALKGIENGCIIQDRAISIMWTGSGNSRELKGILLENSGELLTRSVVVATGTFLRGKLFVGSAVREGGRRGARSTVRLARSLDETGLPLIRLKTGTCPRLYGDSIDFSRLEVQPGDIPPPFFDPQTVETTLPQLTCHLAYTSEKSHDIIRKNLSKSSLYNGSISGIGPRYCPSIETKIERFEDKRRHQVFLEPEDQHGKLIYPSGLSTSLPESVQEEMVHAIAGLEKARIARFGYAVEYDAIQPKALTQYLEVDGFKGLFLAGQILGTSGYEEAAALGLLAGANAALMARGDQPICLSRDRAYAGVMVDDLTTLGVDEPYRMFTSRAEYRLLLREDNADERLLDEGLRTGLLEPERAERVKEKLSKVREIEDLLKGTVLTPSSSTNARLKDAGLPRIVKPTNCFDLLRRNDVRLGDLRPLLTGLNDLPEAVGARIEVDIKYSGYLERQKNQAMSLANVDKVVLPPGMKFDSVPGLKAEVVEKLNLARPTTLGQASRIPGVTPSAIQILHLWCERKSEI